MEARVLTMDGGERTISEEQLTALEAELRGDLLLPESDGYDAARTLWNAMIDRRPALVARCAGPADVMRAVRFAADNELLLAVRGAGHNIAGKGVCDRGFLIDLSGLRSVHVDAQRKIATVDPGASTPWCPAFPATALRSAAGSRRSSSAFRSPATPWSSSPPGSPRG